MAAAGVRIAAIEHVGSTSVPGLAAKPIIDCDIVVAEADVTAAASVLVSLGFAPLGELGIPQRWAFKEPARLSGTNTYVIVDGCLSLRNHLAVRDALRADPALRDEYGAVKRKAGARAANIDDYGQAKTANSLFAVGLNGRLEPKGVNAYAVHPGGIMTALQLVEVCKADSETDCRACNQPIRVGKRGFGTHRGDQR